MIRKQHESFHEKDSSF